MYKHDGWLGIESNVIEHRHFSLMANRVCVSSPLSLSIVLSSHLNLLKYNLGSSLVNVIRLHRFKID